MLRSGLQLHHRGFGFLPTPSAQDINACVSDTLPQVFSGLKGKSGRRCEEIVEGGDLLWMELEKRGKICPW